MIIGARAHTTHQAGILARAGMPFVEISVSSAEAFERERGELDLLRQSNGTAFLAHGPEEGNARDLVFLRHDLLPCINGITDRLPAMGISLFTIHFWLDRRFIEQRIIDEKIMILEDMADHAASRGVQLCLENLSERAADFGPAFTAADTLGMTLDIGHAELLSEKNTAHDFLAQHAEKIYHMHVHDNRGGSSPADDLHLVPGEGVIDFRSILNAAAALGYDRTITLEVAPEQALKSRDFILQAWNSATQPERTAR